MQLASSAVSEVAARHALVVLKPASLRTPEVVAALRNTASDVMVVAAYGMILPEAVLAIPGRGCINIHASLLPRWRGAAPIQRAILAGDELTGISIMQMDAGLDTGPVLQSRELRISPRDTAGSLTDGLARLGALAVIDVLARLAELPARAQDESRATYAPKVTKADAVLDWSRSNDQIDRQVRAFNPSPGAHSKLGGQMVKIWEARPAIGTGPPGHILAASDATLLVACGQGALCLEVLQRAGSRRMSASEFLRGFRVTPGTRFETPDALPLGDGGKP